MVNRILQEVSKIRELSVVRPVPASVKTRPQIEKFVSGEIERQASGNEIHAADLYLTQLGLAPKNFNLRASYTSLMGEQIAGFYDSRTRSFTTSDRVRPAELETVMAHELTHALQDQHFGLGKMDKQPKHESDSHLAYSALVEGDATLTMTRYMTANPLRIFGNLASSLGSLGGDQMVELKKTPRILREGLEFPYLGGMKFVAQLQQRGGWAQVSKAFDRVPQSSQQILHFDKYLANKAPIKVEVPDVRRVLGSGWTLLDHDVNGELGLSVIASQNGNETEAKAAAEGWAGDRYAVYSGPKKGVLVIQDSVWDTGAAATRWRLAYAKRTGARFGDKVKERREGTLSVWNAAPDGVWMQQKGRRVVMIEGTVGAFDSKKVLAALFPTSPSRPLLRGR